MEEKKYLNEEKYQQTVGKLKRIGKPVLIIGIILLVLGIIMLIIGMVGSSSAGVNGFINAVNEGSKAANGSYDAVTSGTSIVSTTVSNMGLFIALFIIGSIIGFIGFGLTVAGAIILVIAHEREIKAFGAQSTIPVAKEVVDEVTPTVAGAAGSIAKEVSKGIAEGKEEANKEE